MRLALAIVLIALMWMSPVFLGGAAAPAFMGTHGPSSPQTLRHKAKVVCGDFGEGYTCKTQSGAIRRGKNMAVPGASGDRSSPPVIERGDPDALPPASGGYSGAYQAPSAATANCPANTEMLGGHCIPYTQTCSRGLSANANPQACRGAEEKQVCSFRPDGLKDCCCRTYTKF
jgi:hypothetical protein